MLIKPLKWILPLLVLALAIGGGRYIVSQRPEAPQFTPPQVPVSIDAIRVAPQDYAVVVHSEHVDPAGVGADRGNLAHLPRGRVFRGWRRSRAVGPPRLRTRHRERRGAGRAGRIGPGAGARPGQGRGR